MVKTSSQPLISWQAQEYVQNDKNIGWYIGLILVGMVFVALSIFLQWWTFLVLVVVSVIALIVYSVRPPRKLDYSLSNSGIIIEKNLRKYSDFKAFGVMQEKGHYSIVLIPRKRFSPKLTIFFPQEKGEQIVDIFGARLPMQQIKPDFLDKIVNFLRI